jgi:serralysin
MASYIAYNPTSLMGRAFFNFDEFGVANFKYAGVVQVSVSDSFTYAQAHASAYSESVYTVSSFGRTGWSATQLTNINALLGTFQAFAGLKFSAVTNYTGYTPAQVGGLSDINISLVSQPSGDFAGESAINQDSSFGYANAQGDLVLNVNGFGGDGVRNDASFGGSSFGFHTLMHEMGHSLGLAHPHSNYTNNVPTLTSDFAALVGVGFQQLGFVVRSPLDLYKEYFSVMSYDDQTPANAAESYAQTPMILDVIALQEAYGPGTGSSGAADDVVTPGGDGGVGAYRTYFDTGGVDTVDLVNYASGAYFHMGVAIVGAQYAVGVSMSRADELAMAQPQVGPSSLRWFYGAFENALGSAGNDRIVGNALANRLTGNAGDDTLDGGLGIDTAVLGATRAASVVTRVATGWTVSSLQDGRDTLAGIERLQFADQKLALDLSGAAGTAAKLIGAVFGPAAVHNLDYVGVALGLLDTGWSAQQLGDAAVRLFNPQTNFDVVSVLWTAVLGAPPSVQSAAPIVALLDGGMGVGALTVLVSDLELNTANIGLVGLANTGLAYL